MSQRVKSPPAVPWLIAIVAVFALCFGFIGEPTMDSPVTNLDSSHQSIEVATTSIATVVPAITSTLAAVPSQTLTCVSLSFCTTAFTTITAQHLPAPNLYATALLTLLMAVGLYAAYSVRHNELLNRTTRRLLARFRLGMKNLTPMSVRLLREALSPITYGLGSLTHNVVTWTRLWHSVTMPASVVALVLGSLGAALGCADVNLVLSAATWLMVSALIVNSRLHASIRTSFIPSVVAGGETDDFLKTAAGPSNPLNALPAPQDPTSETANMKINTINVSPATHSVFHARGSIVENMVTRRVNEIGNCENWQLSTVNLTHTATMFDHSVLPQYRRPAHLICLTNRICRLHDIEIARGYLVSGTWKPAVAITSRPLDRPTWDAARLTTRELVTA